MPDSKWKEGDRVRIIDGSVAHGDIGTVDTLPDDHQGCIIVFVDQPNDGSYVWPVDRDSDLEAAPTKEQAQ